ncbi:MAG: M17 family peptidase N-terminal domain-containing protein, partial [Planctomycetota bacterium]
MIQSVAPASSRSKSQALVLGHFKGKSLSRACMIHEEDGRLANALKRTEASGDLGSVTEVFEVGDYDRVLVVGLGEEKKFDEGAFRKVAAAAGRRLDAAGIERVTACFAGPIESSHVDANLAGVAFGEGLGLLAFDKTVYKGSASNKPTSNKLAV